MVIIIYTIYIYILYYILVILAIVIYIRQQHHSNVQLFFCTHITITYIHGAISLAPPCSFPLLPLPPPLLPFVSLSTYLAPSSCDRNRPPPSQVACKLTLFAPPFTQLSNPSQLPRTPTVQRLPTTTLGLFRSCYTEHSLPEVAVGC